MEGPGIHTRQRSVLPRLNCPVPSRVKLQGRDLSLPESQSHHLAVDERENGADLGNLRVAIGAARKERGRNSARFPHTGGPQGYATLGNLIGFRVPVETVRRVFLLDLVFYLIRRN